jgi:hypothetical protein
VAVVLETNGQGRTSTWQARATIKTGKMPVPLSILAAHKTGRGGGWFVWPAAAGQVSTGQLTMAIKAWKAGN